MNYRNFAPRCDHGFMRSVVPCPVCDGSPKHKHCEPSVVRHAVHNRAQGRARGHRARGYSSDLGGGRQ